MRMTRSSLITAALIAAALPALAQTEEAPSGPAIGDLPLGQTVSGEPGVGEPYERDTYGDWSLRCVRTEGGNDPCRLYQLLEDDNGNSVAEMSLFAVPPGQQAEAGATIITPLETLLTEQLRITVDDGQTKVYPFTFCNQIGCVARVGFTDEEVAEFRRGAEATMVIVPVAAPDQEVTLTISLSGFTAGFDAVREANAPDN